MAGPFLGMAAKIMGWRAGFEGRLHGLGIRPSELQIQKHTRIKKLLVRSGLANF
jgi:hypothetical protein